MEYKNQHGSNSAVTSNNSSNHNVVAEIKNEYTQCKRQLAKYQNSTTAACVVVAILAAPLALTILSTASTNKNFELLSIAVGILLIAISLSVVAIIRVYKHNKLSKQEWRLRQEYSASKSLVGKDKVLDVNSISRDEIDLLNTSDELQRDNSKDDSTMPLGRAILVFILGVLLFTTAKWLLFSKPKPDMTPSTTNGNTTITQPTTTQQQTTTTQPTYTQPTYTQPTTTQQQTTTTQPTYTQPQSIHCSSQTVGSSTYTNCY